MALAPLTDFVPCEEAGSASRLFAEPQEIRILIYTDDHKVKDENNERDALGLGLMKKFMTAQQSELGKPVITVVNRNGDSCETQHASRRLTSLLPAAGGGFDQVWFFGVHIANLTRIICDPAATLSDKGGPDSELTEEEVERLRCWMRTGGVLVTGDHSSAHSPHVKDPTLKPVLSLGRALGHRVPRAGQLRTWECGPTTVEQDSYNTHDSSCATNLNSRELQEDGSPQRIIALRLNARGGLDPLRGRPHYLFTGRRGCAIDVFPDHMHEGKVCVPRDDQLSGDWPADGPRPFVVAVGTDKRTGQAYDLVAVYEGNGGSQPAGRIVADSTWHHYFNLNINGFAGDMSEGSVADRLGQYYYNLAVWLSSREKQRKMTCAMFWWLANHPALAEEGRESEFRLGQLARHLVARVASPGQVNELLLAYTPNSVRAKLPLLYYPEESFTLAPLPSQELILGSVVRQYFEEIARPADDSRRSRPEGVGEACDRVIREGFKEAFQTHAKILSGTRAKAREFRRGFV